MPAPRPIIVVTGANSGVGFGICHRLLVQLAQKPTPDAEPQFKSLRPHKTPLDDAPTESYDGLTLIMACRSEKKALQAKRQLLALLDAAVAAEKRKPGYDGHAETFRKNLEINFHCVDMSVVSTVFRFGDELARTYPYISHLICNAGCAFWTGVDKISAIRTILTRGLIWSITLPPFKLQHTGRMSADGLGCTWQSNVFGHYVMYRYLQPLFSAYARESGTPARVIWMSSLEAQPCWYDHDDWQLTKTDHSYEASKYEVDLIASKLSERSLQPGGEGKSIRHFIVHPGIVHSNMTNGMVLWFLDQLKVILFYFARWLGSPNHCVDSYLSAVSATHIALVSLLAIPTSLLAYAHVRAKDNPPATLWDDSLATTALYDSGHRSSEEARATEERGEFVPIKFSSEVDRWGSEHVNAMPVLEWKAHEKEGEFLLDKCEALYRSFSKLEKEGVPQKTNGTAH